LDAAVRKLPINAARVKWGMGAKATSVGFRT